MADPVKFNCVICEHEFKLTRYGWPTYAPGPDMIIPPVCRGCEDDYGTIIRAAGSFRDRRIIAQVGALAEALRCEAARKEWSHQYAST